MPKTPPTLEQVLAIKHWHPCDLNTHTLSKCSRLARHDHALEWGAEVPMSNWNFEEMGEFGSDADADRWAKRQGLAPEDVRISRKGEGVELEVRRSALGDSGTRHNDRRDGRSNGFF